MVNVVFFNNYHNGDILHSKAFVSHTIEILQTLGEFYFHYAHNSPENILFDLPVETIRTRYDDEITIAKNTTGDILYINTWVGAYFRQGLPFGGECTLRFQYGMWKVIFSNLNSLFNTDKFILKYIKQYLPSIDYNLLDRQSMNDWIKKSTYENLILFCNGPALSGQCLYNGNMSEIIKPLAHKFPKLGFIATERFSGEHFNIHFTDDIIGTREQGKSDLNEISYLAAYCDMIVGRNSGPFCFAASRTNLHDPNKLFYSFGGRISDQFSHGVATPSHNYFKYYTENHHPREIEADLELLIRGRNL